MYRIFKLMAVCFCVTLAACSGGSPGKNAPQDSAKRSPRGEPLPSWTDGPAKSAITGFVAKVTDAGSPQFIPGEDRIAVFDNDGTLWSEQPLYFQFYFALDQVKRLAAENPSWSKEEPFASVLRNDIAGALKSGEKGIAQIVLRTHTGMTTTEFEQQVRTWIDTAKHPLKQRRFRSMTYQPMTELIRYLQDAGFKTYIVSGGGVEFMRPWTAAAYGIPPEQVVGSTAKLQFELKNDTPYIRKMPGIGFIDDGPGKPVGIELAIGKRPVAAFGNSDGDLQMLQWTAAGPGEHLVMIVHHTDSLREWAYDRNSHVGRLDKAMDEANAKGWTLIDMRKDWKTIYPEP